MSGDGYGSAGRGARLALRALVLASAVGQAPAAWAQGVAPERFEDDPQLARLVEDALERRPEHAQARAAVQAERERVPQAGAFPDPTLTLGIQNDGFGSIQIGKMETSFWQVMLTQPLLWPGKAGLREAVATRKVAVAEAGLARVRLTVEAEVRRAFLALVLSRSQLGLLERLEALWAQWEGLARARYTSGQAPQAELLRSQLERTRLQAQRLGLELAIRNDVQELNRVRGHPLSEPVPTQRELPEYALPAARPLDAALDDAERRSPELGQARAAVRVAQERVALARRERWPDLAVSASVMPRGSLEPMWAASLSVGVPIWEGRKQGRAVAESEAREQGEAHAESAVRDVLRLRTEERVEQLQTAVAQAALYRDALLVQSQALVESALAGYRVGRVPFASVLEALTGYVADGAANLEVLAQAHQIAIAQRELSLEPTPGPAGGLAVPGMSASGGRAAGMGSSGGTGRAAASTAPPEESGGAAAAAGGM